MSTETSTITDEREIRRITNRDKGIAYARRAGVACGLFLLIWTPLNAIRWDGQGPNWLLVWETFLYTLLAIWMLLPWKKIEPLPLWKPCFILLCALAALFGFTLVIDLMFQYMHAAEFGQKPAPPAFQSLMAFIVLMQPPVVLFQKRPTLLD